MKTRVLANHEFYDNLKQVMLDIGDLNDGIIDIYFLPSLDGKLFLVNSHAKELGYHYEAVYKMSNGQIEFYKIMESDDST